MIRSRRRDNRPAQRTGAALVEMAMTFPLFLMVILGIVEFGRGMMVSQLMTNAAREGARQAVMTGSTNEEVETTIKDFLTSTMSISESDIDIQIEITPAANNPDPNGSLANANSRDLVSITVQVPFSKVSYIAGEYLNSTQMIGQCAMRHE